MLSSGRLRVLCNRTQPIKQLCRPPAFIRLWRAADEAGVSGGREPVSSVGGVMTKEGRVEDVGRSRGMFSAERERERDWGTAVESVFILGKY